jgi:glycosyltransferase involved in cell wall biosynthesis
VALIDPGVLPHRLDVYGDGPFRPAVEAAIAGTGTADRVHLNGRVPIDDLPALLAGSDIGLVPSRPEPYLQYSLSTKLLEYAAMEVPIIATDLATFRAHFSDTAIRYVPGGDPTAVAAAIRELAADPAAASRVGAEAHRQAEAYAWEVQAARYLEIVERLIGSAH